MKTKKLRSENIILVMLLVLVLTLSTTTLARQINRGQNSSVQETQSDSPVWASAGSVDVTKSARWTNVTNGEAEITLQLNTIPAKITMPCNTDIIFIGDQSNSMKKGGSGNKGVEKFVPFRNALADELETLLKENETYGYNNRFSFCLFSSSLYWFCPTCGKIAISGHPMYSKCTHNQLFSTKAEMDRAIAGLRNEYNGKGSTGYDLPFYYVDWVLSNRADQSRKACVIFLTDGGPYPMEPDRSFPDPNTKKYTNRYFKQYADFIKANYNATIYGIALDLGSDSVTERIGTGYYESVLSTNAYGQPLSYNVTKSGDIYSKISEIYDEIIGDYIGAKSDAMSSFTIVDTINSDIFNMNGTLTTAISTNIGTASLSRKHCNLEYL